MKRGTASIFQICSAIVRLAAERFSDSMRLKLTAILCMEVNKMQITDRYGEPLKEPAQKPTLEQALHAWYLLNELLDLGYPHNFQYEKQHISNYLFDLSALIDKAFKIKKGTKNNDLTLIYKPSFHSRGQSHGICRGLRTGRIR
jgi:hypothetical protein